MWQTSENTPHLDFLSPTALQYISFLHVLQFTKVILTLDFIFSKECFLLICQNLQAPEPPLFQTHLWSSSGLDCHCAQTYKLHDYHCVAKISKYMLNSRYSSGSWPLWPLSCNVVIFEEGAGGLLTQSPINETFGGRVVFESSKGICKVPLCVYLVVVGRCPHGLHPCVFMRPV